VKRGHVPQVEKNQFEAGGGQEGTAGLGDLGRRGSYRRVGASSAEGKKTLETEGLKKASLKTSNADIANHAGNLEMINTKDEEQKKGGQGKGP